MTARLAKERGFDWKSWWQKPDEVELFQFIGKDNIPFHTVIFPSSLLGTGKMDYAASYVQYRISQL